MPGGLHILSRTWAKFLGGRSAIGTVQAHGVPPPLGAALLRYNRSADVATTHDAAPLSANFVRSFVLGVHAYESDACAARPQLAPG